MKHMLWWIPSLIVVMSLTAFTNYQSSLHKTKFWFFMGWLLLLIPMWPLVARVTKPSEFMITGILFDIILVVAYTAFAAYFSQDYSTLHWYNWLGLGIILIGFICLKLP